MILFLLHFSYGHFWGKKEQREKPANQQTALVKEAETGSGFSVRRGK